MLLGGHNPPELSTRGLRAAKRGLVKSLIVQRETDTEANYPGVNKGFMACHWDLDKYRKSSTELITVKKETSQRGIYYERPQVSSGDALYTQDWCFPQTAFLCVSKLRHENMLSLCPVTDALLPSFHPSSLNLIGLPSSFLPWLKIYERSFLR